MHLIWKLLEAKFADWQKNHENAVMDHVKSVEDKASKPRLKKLLVTRPSVRSASQLNKKAVAEAKLLQKQSTVEASAGSSRRGGSDRAAETEAPVAEAATEEAPAVEEAPLLEEAAEEPKTEKE